MIITIRVKALTAAAERLRHPNGVAMKEGGVDWPNDSFTFRRIRDGDIRQIEPQVAPVKPVVKPGRRGKR